MMGTQTNKRYLSAALNVIMSPLYEKLKQEFHEKVSQEIDKEYKLLKKTKKRR